MSVTRRRTDSMSTGSEMPQGTYTMKWPKSVPKLGVEFGPSDGPNSWPIIDRIDPDTHAAEQVEEDRKHGRPYLVKGMKLREIRAGTVFRTLDTLPMADGIQAIVGLREQSKEVELVFVDTVWQLHTGAGSNNYCCGDCNRSITGRRFRKRGEERNLCEECYTKLDDATRTKKVADLTAELASLRTPEALQERATEAGVDKARLEGVIDADEITNLMLKMCGGDDLENYEEFDGTVPHIAGADGFLQRFEVLMSGTNMAVRDTSVPTPPVTPEKALRDGTALVGIEEGYPPELGLIGVRGSYFDEPEPEPEHGSGAVDPQWQANKDYSRCPMCTRQFSQKTRRHHCRKCGKIGCASCLKHKLPLPDRMTKEGPKALAKKKKQRVCGQCFEDVPRELAALQAIGAFRDFAGMHDLDAVAGKLGEHIEDERLVSDGCTWLADLTIGDEDEGEDEGWRGLETSEAAHPPVEKPVLDVVLQALLHHPSVEHIQAECCRALANLGGSGIANAAANRELITAAGGLAYVIKALRLHPLSAVVQEHGCNALSSLAHNMTKANKTSNKAVIESMGGVELGLTAIRNFPHLASVQTTACRMLEALMGTEIPGVGGYGGGEDHGTGPALTIVDGDIEVEDGRVETGIGVGLLLSVLQAHPADTDAQAAACTALAALGALRPAREDQARRQNSAKSDGAGSAADGDRPCVFSRVRRVLLTTTVPASPPSRGAAGGGAGRPHSFPAADAAAAFEFEQQSSWPGKSGHLAGASDPSRDRDDEQDATGTAAAAATQQESGGMPAVELLALSVLGVADTTIQAQGCQLLRALAGCLKPEIVRQCIEAIYHQHAPEKVAKLETLLYEWRGREALLLGNVEYKHCLYGGSDGGAKVISGAAKIRQAVLTTPFFDADDEETPPAEDAASTGQQQQQQPPTPKGVSQLPFPKKKMWGNTGESVLAERQTALQVWLDAVLSSHPADADLVAWLALSSPPAVRITWGEFETRQGDGGEYTIFRLEAFGLEDDDEVGGGSVLEKRYSDFCSLRDTLLQKESVAVAVGGGDQEEEELVRLTFETGPLGIELVWGQHAKKDWGSLFPVVETILPKTQADRHSKARALSVGMKLLAVEGESLENKTPAEGGQIFKSHGRPVELTFSRPITAPSAAAPPAPSCAGGNNHHAISEGVPPSRDKPAVAATPAAAPSGSGGGGGEGGGGWGAAEWAPDGRDHVLQCLRRALERKAVQTLDADGNLERVRPGQKAINQLQRDLNELVAQEQFSYGNAGKRVRPNLRIFVEGRGQGTVGGDGTPTQPSSTWSSAFTELISIDNGNGGTGNGGNGSNTKGLCHTVLFDLAEGEQEELINLSKTTWGCGDTQIEEMEATQSLCMNDAMARKETGTRLMTEGKYDEAQTNFEVGLTSARRTPFAPMQEELKRLIQEVKELQQAAGRGK